jgi:hypothetical protein
MKNIIFFRKEVSGSSICKDTSSKVHLLGPVYHVITVPAIPTHCGLLNLIVEVQSLIRVVRSPCIIAKNEAIDIFKRASHQVLAERTLAFGCDL